MKNEKRSIINILTVFFLFFIKNVLNFFKNKLLISVLRTLINMILIKIVLRILESITNVVCMY